MIQRISCLISCLVIAFGLLVVPPAISGEVGDDGLHKQPWFTVTFNDIAEDIETARNEGKRLAIIFEQRGCSYCKTLHEKVFSDPEVSAFIRENFMVVQMNLYGAGEVTDLDGKALNEKTAARRWRILYTPTVLFLPDEVPAEAESVRDVVVATMPGAFQKGTVLHMFQWVSEKGYQKEASFQEYHARKLGGSAE